MTFVVGAPDASIFLCAGCVAVLDALWFSVSLDRFYPKVPEAVPEYGALAWASIAVGLSTAQPYDAPSAAAFGALFGAVVYTTFNGTEAAIRADWRSPAVWIADIAWGVAVCAATSTVRFAVQSYTPPEVTLVIGLAIDAVVLLALVCARGATVFKALSSIVSGSA